MKFCLARDVPVFCWTAIVQRRREMREMRVSRLRGVDVHSKGSFEVFEQLPSVDMGIAHNGRPFAEPVSKKRPGRRSSSTVFLKNSGLGASGKDGWSDVNIKHGKLSRLIGKIP